MQISLTHQYVHTPSSGLGTYSPVPFLSHYTLRTPISTCELVELEILQVPVMSTQGLVYETNLLVSANMLI